MSDPMTEDRAEAAAGDVPGDVLVSARALGRVFDVSKPWLNRVIERDERVFLTAAEDVTFDIRRGKTFALVGESGSGKSTIAKMIVGLLRPTSGAVSYTHLIMRLVRSEMLEVLRTDYIRFARARGLRRQAIYFTHALKNTLVPVITVTGLQLGSIIAFAIITETVFQWPGVGLLFINAISFVDIPVMAAYLLLVGAVFVTINLIVDLLYFAIDPRVRFDSPGKGG